MNKLSFAVIANRNQTFFIRHYPPRELRAKPEMYYIVTYVRVALATSDFIQNILDIPATYEIHREYQNRGLA